MKGNQATNQHDMTTARHLHQLLAISRALTESSGEELLVMVADTAADLTESATAMLLLLDSYTGEFNLVPKQANGEEARTKVPIEGSAAGWVLRHREPLLLNNGAAELDLFLETRSSGEQPAKNLAAVPLATRGRVIGVLEVSNKQESVGYDQQDIQLLKALASVAAITTDNQQLLEQTDRIAEFMHEVKTPLMALTAASELLARDSLGQKQVDLIEMIQRETMRLSTMAQDFLDLTRLESGRAQLNQEAVDLTEIIDDVIRLQEPQAAARDITINVKVESDLPIITGDYDRLRQVFLNLTSNAIKYNEEHGQIMIAACKLDEELEVEISDTGPGIAAEYLPHLFERFYRIPDSEGFTKGTGLGLSIAARLLREHGGRIELQSQLGQGSTFRCYLPISP